MIRDIRKKLDMNKISDEEIGAALSLLDHDGHIHYDSQTEKIYTWFGIVDLYLVFN